MAVSGQTQNNVGMLVEVVGGPAADAHPSGLWNILNAPGRRQGLCPVKEHHLLDETLN